MSDARTLTVEVQQRVDGPPDVVFSYFIDAEKYCRWKGVDAELDPRPGGIYRVTMAPDVWVRGEFVTVEPPHRLVMTWGFESHGFELPRGLREVPPGSSTVEFTFVPDGDGTIVRVRHDGLPNEETAFAHELGWTSYFPRLVSLFAAGDPGDDPAVAMAQVLYARDADG